MADARLREAKENFLNGVKPPAEAAPVEATDPKTEAKEEVQAKPEVKPAEDPDFTEEDLQTLSEQKKIPYNRFKEVNDQKKALQSEFQSLKERYEQVIAEQEIRNQAKATQSSSDDVNLSDLDPYDRDARELRSQVSQLQNQLKGLQDQTVQERLQNRINKLEQKYPSADPLAVLGWAKSQPSTDIEELMELSHNRNVERAEQQIRTILEKKKTRAQAAVPSKRGGIRLAPEHRPTTWAEAKKMSKDLKRWI